jgi:hypothetical protein
VARGNNSDGIYVDLNCSSNTIGGGRSAPSNISSGNGRDGIYMLGSSNVIQLNYFGLNNDGAQLPNSFKGAEEFGHNQWGDGHGDNNRYQTGGSVRRWNPEATGTTEKVTSQTWAEPISHKTDGGVVAVSNSRLALQINDSRSLATWTAPKPVPPRILLEFLFRDSIGPVMPTDNSGS